MFNCVPDGNDGADCLLQNLSWLNEQSAFLQTYE